MNVINSDTLITDVLAGLLHRDGRRLYGGPDGYFVCYASCEHVRVIRDVDIAELKSESEFKDYVKSLLKCDRPECNQLTGEDAYWHACTGTPID